MQHTHAPLPLQCTFSFSFLDVLDELHHLLPDLPDHTVPLVPQVGKLLVLRLAPDAGRVGLLCVGFGLLGVEGKGREESGLVKKQESESVMHADTAHPHPYCPHKHMQDSGGGTYTKVQAGGSLGHVHALVGVAAGVGGSGILVKGQRDLPKGSSGGAHPNRKGQKGRHPGV